MPAKIEIRPIKEKDTLGIAAIIQATLIEYDGNKPGTAFYDTSTTNMYKAYQGEREIYFVALLNDVIIGGCGIKKLDKANPEVCELQKMYLLPKSRGLKIGKQLLDRCIDFARKSAYKQCYLETFPHMYKAIELYRANGFYTIDQALGNTGHTACDVWMLKDLKA